MKIIANFLLVVLLVSSNGCMTYGVANLAKGRTTEKIDRSQIERGDEVWDGDHGVAYVVKHPADKDTSQMEMPVVKDYYYEFYIAKPHPAYYALTPLSVPLDIATCPIQIIVIGVKMIVAPDTR